MAGFWNVKIYRRKFIGYVTFLTVISIMLSAATCVFFVNRWITAAQEEALGAFERTEALLKSTVDKLESYIQRLYTSQNNGLMKDLIRLLDNDAEGYLLSRLSASRADESIPSFPEDARYFLMGSPVVEVSLQNPRYSNVISFNEKTGISFSFKISNTDARFEQDITKGLIYRKRIADPSKKDEWLGEFLFLISSEEIFKGISGANLGSVAAVGDSGVYPIQEYDGRMNALLPGILDSLNARGTVSAGGLNLAHYVTHTSPSFSFKLVDIIHTGDILRQNAVNLIFINAIFLLVLLSVLALIIVNLNNDARFLSLIIEMIENAKVGDFSSEMPRLRRFRKNEYGMLAEELGDMGKKLERHIKTEYLLKLRQKETEMKALQNQINPHFLYNTLEIIRSSALQNGDESVSDAIASLGAMYRDIVKNENVITIGKELDILIQYLRLMEFKYPDNFVYQIDVPPELYDLPTIKFWMQPLAENFFVHGFDPKNDYNLLIVSGHMKKERWVLEIFDNGRAMSEEELTRINGYFQNPGRKADEGVGLQNVYSRLSFFYGSSFHMEVENNRGAGVRVEVSAEKEGNAVV